MPIRNVGSETPTRDKVMIVLEAQLLRLIAVITPSPIPNTSAITPDTAASSSVAGARSAMISATGRPCR